MSFLEDSSSGLDAGGTSLLDCPDSGKASGADWPHQDLLDTSGVSADFDISSFFHSLAGTDTSEKGDDAGAQIMVPELPLHEMPEQAVDGDTNPADVSLSALLGEHADLQAALMAPPQDVTSDEDLVLRHPSVPPPSSVKLVPLPSPTPPAPKKTFVVVKKEPAKRQGRPRRTKPPFGDPPPAPATAYNIFYKAMYHHHKARWKGMSVRRAVPYISKLWKKMNEKEKERYHEAAEEARAEYKAKIAEYRERVRVWKLQMQQGGDANVDADVLVDDPPKIGSDQDHELDDDNNDLYCQLCNQYFSNSHNKLEHLEGRLHLRKLHLQNEEKAKNLKETTLESTAAASENGEPGSGVADENVEERSDDEDHPSDSLEEPACVQDAMETLMLSVLRRSQECRYLTGNQLQLSALQLQLSEQLQQLESRRQRASAELEECQQQSRVMTEQLENLLLLPTMFGVMSQWSSGGGS